MRDETMTDDRIKAWTYTSGGYPSSLKFGTIPKPTASSIARNHIHVRIHAAAVNPVDIQIMNLPVWSIPYSAFQQTKTVSSDFSGAVVATAPGTGFVVGDEVFGVNMAPFKPGSGTMAEVADFDLAATPVVRKPAIWTHTQAAGLGCVFLTAHTCVNGVAPWVDASSSKRVVVLGGSSATGIYTIMLCKRRGWKVLTSCSGRNVDFVTKTLGADEVVDYTKQSVREAVKAFAPAAIIDDVGGKECLGIAKRYVTIVGDKTGRSSMGGAMTYLWSPLQWLRWAIGYVGLGERYDVLNLEAKRENLEEAKQLKPSEIIIDSVHPFEEANKAFEKLNSGRARGKVIVEMIQS